MKKFEVKCPAKINLTLEVLGKRPDGFHDIQSVMQTINLYDILTITTEESISTNINLSGTSTEIPYDEKNLVHKATKMFLDYAENEITSPQNISIHIEKNIPISAGLAGGSTDAAGTIYGLNKIFNNILSQNQLHEICAKLGSDLNFCLEGGCMLTTGRGEILKPLPFRNFNLSLIKPKNLGISAKEAYTKFSALENKPNLNMTAKMISALNSNSDLKNYLHNDLEIALLEDYSELKLIKTACPNSIMSGSGSTFFALEDNFKNFPPEYQVFNNLKSIPSSFND